MLVMRCLVAVAVVFSLLSGWSWAQAPGDAQSFCTETFPSVGVNILDYPPEVKPLMDSHHYQQLLPPNTGAVWQTVDNDNNNPSHARTSWIQASSSFCRVTVSVCGFSAGTQDNWITTQHISRIVNGTALQQVTVQVDFIMNTCDILNNCRRSFAIHKYETSTISTTAARNLSNYELVGQIVPRDGSGAVRENASVNINFATEATGFYLGIQDEASCILIHRVLVFYYRADEDPPEMGCTPMVSNVTVKAANATALLVSWDTLQDSYLLHYTIYYSAFSPLLSKVVDKFTKVVSSANALDIVNIRQLRAGVEHELQVTASLEIEGKVYEGVKSVPAKMVFDEAVFQLQVGPVTSCAAWSTNKAEKIESYIHIEIAKIISDHCKCEFPATFIRSGTFQCWNAQDEVTYRSVIVGMEHHNATELLRSLEEWVNSEPVLQVGKLGLWVSTKCPVQISSLSDPQCPSFRQPPAGAQCGNVCTCTVRSEHPQTSTKG